MKAPKIAMEKSDHLRTFVISGIPKTTPTPLKNRRSARK